MEKKTIGVRELKKVTERERDQIKGVKTKIVRISVRKKECVREKEKVREELIERERVLTANTGEITFYGDCTKKT